MKFRFVKELVFREDFNDLENRGYVGIYIPENKNKDGQIHAFLSFNHINQIKDTVHHLKLRYPNYRYKYNIIAHPVFKDYL